MRVFYTKSRTFKGMNFEQYFKSEYFRSLRLCMFAEGICQETNELQKKGAACFSSQINFHALLVSISFISWKS